MYICDVKNNDISNIILQEDEHDEYKLIDSLEEMKDELIANFVVNVIKHVR